jgi:hypothetical protein
VCVCLKQISCSRPCCFISSSPPACSCSFSTSFPAFVILPLARTPRMCFDICDTVGLYSLLNIGRCLLHLNLLHRYAIIFGLFAHYLFDVPASSQMTLLGFRFSNKLLLYAMGAQVRSNEHPDELPRSTQSHVCICVQSIVNMNNARVCVTFVFFLVCASLGVHGGSFSLQTIQHR